MYTDAVSVMLQLRLWHNFYTTVLKIKHKLHIASWSALPPPPPPKEIFWVRAWVKNPYFSDMTPRHWVIGF